MYKSIDVSGFPADREQKLKSIYRFSMFETLIYRSNLWMHTHRVLWLVEELLPVAQRHLKIDAEMARTLALVHDDAEMLTGDVQAGHKARMSIEELCAIELSVEEAIETLAAKSPKTINGYVYKDLLLHTLKKDCIEAELVSYLDKLDAQCESLHEVLAGNTSLLRSVMFYVNILTLFPRKFPDLAPLLSSKESSLTYITDVVSPEHVYVKRYAHLNKLHTVESLKIEDDFPFYNAWKRIVMEKGGKQGIKWLTEQKESLHLS
ncbi:MAG: HD domain-containing protein [Candidatus Pacebacteria bacterium]|nr:HD domain-containing protein [Candidatus Paceibacterota bacterium]